MNQRVSILALILACVLPADIGATGITTVETHSSGGCDAPVQVSSDEDTLALYHLDDSFQVLGTTIAEEGGTYPWINFENTMPVVWGKAGASGTNYARNLTGVNTGTITTNATIQLFLYGSWTMEMWVYPTSFASANGLTEHSATGETEDTNFLYRVLINTNGTLGMFWEHGAGVNDSFASSTGTVTLNAWNHVAVVKEVSGLNATITYYINGVNAGSGGTLTNTTGGTSGQWIIPGTTSLTGVLDDMHFSSVARTPGEIAANAAADTHTRDASTFALWRFDEAPSAKDDGPFGYHLRAPLEGIVTSPLLSGVGTAYGSESTAHLTTDGPSTQLSCSAFQGEWTVEMWAQLTDLTPTASQTLIGCGASGESLATNWQLLVWVNPAGQFVLFWEHSGTATDVGASSAPLPMSIRHARNHYALVKSENSGTPGTYDVALYVNGAFYETLGTALVPPSGGTSGTFQLANTMTGVLDDVRVSSVPRTANQIQRTYDAGKCP